MTMHKTLAGAGLRLVDDASDPEVVESEMIEESTPRPDLRSVPSHQPVQPEEISPITLDALRQEFQRAVADIEFRLAQQYELKLRMATGQMDKVYVEDIVDQQHRLTGYQMLSNSNGSGTLAGSIAWKQLHIVHLGVDYTIADGTTANKYAWFVKPGSYTPPTPVALQTGNSLPLLGPDDALVFVNNSGTAISAMETSIPMAIGPGTVGDDQVTSISQSKVSGLSGALTTLEGSIDNVVAIAEGAISQHFGPDFPWANGSSQPSSATGDVYTAQNSTDTTARPNGQSWRWSGSGGSPANTWILIEDSAVTKALADSAAALSGVSSKTTTFFANNASIPTSLAVGDEWVVLDQNNKRRRAAMAGANEIKAGEWEDTLIGNSALDTGLDAAKVTTGVLPLAQTPTIPLATKVSGTLAGSAVGTGINPANLTGAGTAPQAAIPTLSPAKLNTAFHMLY